MEEAPRQFHFHEFRGPVDRSSNLGQRGGKRPGAGRPRLYRDGEKPRYKYRYRYINVSEEVFSKFQRLKFEAGCKAEKNFMILLLDLYERHNRNFESCIDVGPSGNLQRWKNLCSQLSLTSDQTARFLLDLAEQHLLRGRCPENSVLPSLSTCTNQGPTTDASNTDAVIKTEPQETVTNTTSTNEMVKDSNNLTFGNLSELLRRNVELANVPSLMPLMPMAPAQPAVSVQSPNPQAMRSEGSNASKNTQLSANMYQGLSPEQAPAPGTPGKSPQPYVTFKWWNVFPSERSKRKSRCNQISNLLASDKQDRSDFKQQTSRFNVMKETSGYIPKSISQILPKPASSPVNTAPQTRQMAMAETVSALPVYSPHTTIATPTNPPTEMVQNVQVPLVWSMLQPQANHGVVAPVCSPLYNAPVVKDADLPLNLSMKAGSAQPTSKPPSPMNVPRVKVESAESVSPSSINMAAMMDGAPDVNVEQKSKMAALSDPKVQRKVQNLMSTIQKIGGHNNNNNNNTFQSKTINPPKINDSPPETIIDGEIITQDASAHMKSSRKMLIPTKKPCELLEVKQESNVNIVEVINPELPQIVAPVANNGNTQKRSYETRSSAPVSEPAPPAANHDPDGKYYIMSLCKKKKLNDPEFGRWSFAKTRSWQKNGKRQWKINRIENYICKSCGKTFMSEKWFIKHVEAEHCGKNKDIKCILPEEPAQGTSLDHVDITESHVDFTCNVCSKSFGHETEFFLHKSSGPCHKKDDYMTEGFHRCTVSDCCRIFSSEYNLFQHKKRCHEG